MHAEALEKLIARRLKDRFNIKCKKIVRTRVNCEIRKSAQQPNWSIVTNTVWKRIRSYAGNKKSNQNLMNAREELSNLESRASRLESPPVQIEWRNNLRHQGSTRVNSNRDRRREASTTHQEIEIGDLVRITNSNVANEQFGTVTSATSGRMCFTFIGSGGELIGRGPTWG